MSEEKETSSGLTKPKMPKSVGILTTLHDNPDIVQLESNVLSARTFLSFNADFASSHGLRPLTNFQDINDLVNRIRVFLTWAIRSSAWFCRAFRKYGGHCSNMATLIRERAIERAARVDAVVSHWIAEEEYTRKQFEATLATDPKKRSLNRRAIEQQFSDMRVSFFVKRMIVKELYFHERSAFLKRERAYRAKVSSGMERYHNLRDYLDQICRQQTFVEESGESMGTIQETREILRSEVEKLAEQLRKLLRNPPKFSFTGKTIPLSKLLIAHRDLLPAVLKRAETQPFMRETGVLGGQKNALSGSVVLQTTASSTSEDGIKGTEDLAAPEEGDDDEDEEDDLQSSLAIPNLPLFNMKLLRKEMGLPSSRALITARGGGGGPGGGLSARSMGPQIGGGGVLSARKVSPRKVSPRRTSPRKVSPRETSGNAPGLVLGGCVTTSTTVPLPFSSQTGSKRLSSLVGSRSNSSCTGHEGTQMGMPGRPSLVVRRTSTTSSGAIPSQIPGNPQPTQSSPLHSRPSPPKLCASIVAPNRESFGRDAPSPTLEVPSRTNSLKRVPSPYRLNSLPHNPSVDALRQTTSMPALPASTSSFSPASPTLLSPPQPASPLAGVDYRPVSPCRPQLNPISSTPTFNSDVLTPSPIFLPGSHSPQRRSVTFCMPLAPSSSKISMEGDERPTG